MTSLRWRVIRCVLSALLYLRGYNANMWAGKHAHADKHTLTPQAVCQDEPCELLAHGGGRLPTLFLPP